MDRFAVKINSQNLLSFSRALRGVPRDLKRINGRDTGQDRSPKHATTRGHASRHLSHDWRTKKLPRDPSHCTNSPRGGSFSGIGNINRDVCTLCTHHHGDIDVTTRKIEKKFEKVHAKVNLTSRNQGDAIVTTTSGLNLTSMEKVDK